MERPADFYFFNVRRGLQKPAYCVVYSPYPALLASQLNDIILTAYRGPILPDAILLVAAEKDPSGTLDALRSDVTQAARDRIQGRVSLCYTSIDPQIGTSTFDVICPHGRSTTSLKSFSRSRAWVEDGLRDIFREEDVVITAPPGYAYHKPSGESSPFFLKPDLSLSSSPIMSFVALAIFLRIFSSNEKRIKETSTIYVDTMAIASLAYTLREMLISFGSSNSIRVDSFHSYGGISGVRKPLPGTSLCLISASSSMSLQRKWVTEKGVNPDDAITLLTLQSAKDAKKALFALPFATESHSTGPSELSINIVGETFLPAAEPERKVLIRAEPYLTDVDIQLVAKLANDAVFDVFRLDESSPRQRRALYVDGLKLQKTEAFISWLREVLLQLTRATTKHVIHQDDTASRSLGEEICSQCEVLTGRRPTLINEVDILKDAIEPNCAVVICAAAIGKGSRLLQISRMLRDLHQGPRLYLVGYQVTETRTEARTLKSNIKYRDKYPYDFECFGSVAIGTQLLRSYAFEHHEYSRNAEPLRAAPKAVRDRANRIVNGTSAGSLSLLPFGRKLDSHMCLRTGFAFWPPIYAAGPVQPEVLATVGCILQRAREDSSLRESDRLSSKSFRHVLLDPENFSRYNDGAIQSAFLRCAYPSELDYRTEYAASDFMKQLIMRALARMDSDAGEASLEFLFSLKTGKLKLHADHQREIIAAASLAPCTRQGVRFIKWILRDPVTSNSLVSF